MTNLRKRFLKIYANIPLGLREHEIVAVVNNRSYTYAQLYRSVLDAEIVDEALKKMKAMQIL